MTLITSNLVTSHELLLKVYNITFINNYATQREGGAIYLSKSNLQMTLCGIVSFVMNKARIGGAVHTKASNISVGVNCSIAHNWSTITFQLNTATYSVRAFSSTDSHLYFMGNAHFDSNTAGYGEAMILDGTSNLLLSSNLTTYYVINNTANEKGDVFYYDHSVSSCDRFEQYYNQWPECFASLQGISLKLINNSASKVGSLLYSGKLGICYRYSSKSSVLEGCKYTLKVRLDFCSNLHLLLKSSNNKTKIFFSADTEDVKNCSFQNHSNTQMNISVFPGEKFNVSLTSTETFNLPISTRILHKLLLPTDNIELRHVQHLTKVNTSCSNIISYYLLVNEITKNLLHTLNFIIKIPVTA